MQNMGAQSLCACMTAFVRGVRAYQHSFGHACTQLVYTLVTGKVVKVSVVGFLKSDLGFAVTRFNSPLPLF